MISESPRQLNDGQSFLGRCRLYYTNTYLSVFKDSSRECLYLVIFSKFWKKKKHFQKMVTPSPRGYIQVTSPDIIKQYSINITHVSLPLHMHIRTRSQKTNEFIGSCIFLRGANTLINQDIDLEVLPKCTHTVHLNHAL